MFFKTITIFHKIKKFLCPTPDQSAHLSIYDIFKPIYLMLTSIGMFPLSVSYDKPKNCVITIENSVYKNVLCMVSSIIVLYGFYIVHIENLYSTSEASSFTDAFMTQLNYILEISTLIIYCTIAYIYAFINRYKYVKILKSVIAIWSSIKSRNQNKIFGHLRYQVNVLVMGSLLFVLILQILVNSTRVDGVWKIILVFFSFVYPQMIQMITLAFHYVLVFLVKAILSDLNQQLVDLNKSKKITGDMFLYPRPPNLSLRKVELTYMRAFEVKKDLNDAFEAQILMSTIQCFHSIVSECYILYHGLVAHTHTPHIITNCSIWVLYQFMKVYTLAYSGEKLKNEAVKIGQTLHNIPTEEMDMRTLMEIQHFASMMNNQGFVLTVYQFFPLDATLMSKMVTTVSMYLTMLVQYDKTHKG